MKHDLGKNKANIPQSRWLAYATAGLATAAVNLPSAEAEIHYFNPVRLHLKGSGEEIWRLPITASASLTFYRNPESSPARTTYFADVITVNRYLAVHAIRKGPAPFYAANLRPGSNVSGGSFSSNFLGLIGPRGQFVSAGVGFIGFKFDVGNGAQYGWVRARTDKGGTRENARVTIMDYAFADPGESIAAGQRQEKDPVTRTPAEESLGALALGAAGLAAWRTMRRRIATNSSRKFPVEAEWRSRKVKWPAPLRTG